VSITIRKAFKVEDVATDLDSIPTLSDEGATYGVKRNDTDAVIVIAGTSMTHERTGVYVYTFAEPADDLTYTAWIKWTYDGAINYLQVDITGSIETDFVVSPSDVLEELGISSPTDEETTIATNSITRAFGAVARFLRYDPRYKSHTEYYPQRGIAAGVGRGVWEVNDTEAYLREVSSAATEELQMKNIPIRSITSLYIDYDARSGSKTDAFAAATLKNEGVDFWANSDSLDSSDRKLCLDGILRSAGSWPTTAGTVKVVYVSGYTANEFAGTDGTVDASPIRESILFEATRRVRRMFALKKRTGTGLLPGIVTSENLGDYGYSIDAGSANKLVSGGDLDSSTKERLMDFVNMGLEL